MPCIVRYSLAQLNMVSVVAFESPEVKCNLYGMFIFSLNPCTILMREDFMFQVEQSMHGKKTRVQDPS